MTTLANLTTYFAGESASLLSAIETTKGGLRSLVKELDPVGAATDRLNKQQAMLDNGLKTGRLTLEQHGILVGRLKERYETATQGSQRLGTSLAQQRAGMQQLSFQLGDVATQFASGTKPMIIFAQQGGQVIQAIQMMTNSSKGFLGFLAGPWGQVITAAAIVTAALSAKLFENADAADKAAAGANNYAEALRRLQQMGGSFSFGSEEFTKVNKALLEAEARVGRLRIELNRAPLGGMPVMTAGAPNAATAPVRNRELVQAELRRAQADAEAKRAEIAALMLQQRNRDRIYGHGGSGPANSGGGGGGGGGGGRAGSGGRSAGAASDDAALTRKEQDLRVQMLRDQLAVATTAEQRREIEDALLDEEYAARKAEIEAIQAIGPLQEKRKEHLLADLAARYGQRSDEITVDGRPSSFKQKQAWDRAAEDMAEAAKIADAELDVRRQNLQGQLESARTIAERREIMRALVDLDYDEKRRAEQRIIDLAKIGHATKEMAEAAQMRLDAMNGQKALAQRIAAQGTMGHMEAFIDRLPRDAAEMKEEFDAITVDALNNSLDLASQNVLKLKGFAGQLFNQLIADLIRLQLRSALANGFGGGGGIFGAIGGLFGLGGGINVLGVTPGAGVSLGKNIANLPKMANGGSLLVGEMPGIDKNVLSINGEPKALVSATERLHVTPANDLGGGSPIVFDMRGAVMTEDLLAQAQAIALASAGGIVRSSNERFAKKARRRLA